jgi:hypothetical protein
VSASLLYDEGGNIKTTMRTRIVIMVLAALLAVGVGPALAQKKETTQTPKEYGVYVKAGKNLQRLLPNIVFDEKGILFLESNNPAKLALKDMEYFIVTQSPVGNSRFVFGKDMELDVKKTGELLYVVKPKGLFGRGYFALWINDSAWDFYIE